MQLLSIVDLVVSKGCKPWYQGPGAPIRAKSSLQSAGESRKYISKYIEVIT